MRTRKTPTPKVALALAGGGQLGAIYEIEALCALQDDLGHAMQPALQLAR